LRQIDAIYLAARQRDRSYRSAEAEEAYLRARFDVFSASPEAVARRRREALQDAERRFKKSRLTGEFYAAPLSRKDRNELKLLRWLYPEPKLNLSQLDGDGFEMYRDHPFADLRHCNATASGQIAFGLPHAGLAR
jgi:hypothetical protein